MRRLYFFFIRFLSVKYLELLPYIWLASIGATVFGVSLEIVLLIAFLSIFLMTLHFCTLHVGSNLSWISNLQLGKKSIMRLNYYINLSLGFFALVECGVFLVGFQFLQHLFSLHALSDGSFSLPTQQNNEVGSFISIHIPAALFILISWVENIGSIFFSPYPTPSQRQTQIHVSIRSATISIKQRILRDKILLVFPLIYFMGGYLSYGIVYYMVLIFIMWEFGVQAPARKIMLSQKLQKALQIKARMIAGFFMVAIYLIAQLQIHSRNVSAAAEATVFLGPYSFSSSEKQVANLLEADLPTNQVIDLRDYYLKRFFSGRHVSQGDTHSIRFAEAIRSKSRLKAVFETAQIFSFSDLKYDEIRLLTEKVSSLKKGEDVGRFFRAFVSSKMSPEQVMELLRSPVELDNNLALIRVRFDRNGAYLPVILERLKNFSEKNRWTALLSLSLLTGRHLQITDFSDVMNQKIPLTFFQPDCSALHFKNKREISEKISKDNESQVSLLNICLREKARALDTDSQTAIDQEGWYDFPLSEKKIDRIWDLFKEGSH